jgi:dTDP-4-dehydrorhamnose 3,5-epimerase-like enzyme
MNAFCQSCYGEFHVAGKKESIVCPNCDLERPFFVTFPRVHSDKGNLSFIENLPFDIERIYYLYDVPAGELRGAHAHKTVRRFIIPVAGSFEVVLTTRDKQENRYRLYKPWIALYIPPMYWLQLQEFSSGSVALLLASHKYDADDYIRDWSEFLDSQISSSLSK